MKADEELMTEPESGREGGTESHGAEPEAASLAGLLLAEPGVAKDGRVLVRLDGTHAGGDEMDAAGAGLTRGLPVLLSRGNDAWGGAGRSCHVGQASGLVGEA